MAIKFAPLKISALQATLSKVKTDLLVVGLFESSKKTTKEIDQLDEVTGGAIRSVLKSNDYKASLNETLFIYPTSTKGPKRVLLIGLGAKNDFDLNRCRRAASVIVRECQKTGIKSIAMDIHDLIPEKFNRKDIGQAIAEGLHFGRYDYFDHLPEKAKAKQPIKVTVIDSLAEQVKTLSQGIRIGDKIGAGQNICRHIANQPGNEIHPPELARVCQRVAKQNNLRCKVFNKRQLTDMKMNAILAVGKGSEHEPRLISLEHKGKSKGGPDVVLVGKAITFDTGGISLKPGLGMQDMKFDKSGGCAVIGIMAAVAQLKLKLNVVGLVTSAENMPAHNSYRPGDIIKTYSGKTVEIHNTDAEGRMVLADALWYGAKMKPKIMIDMATLTGACAVALGSHYAGLFTPDNKLASQLEKSGQASGEPVWRLPVGPEYGNEMKSTIADLKNVADRWGGASNAAAFLQEFVGDTPWAHIDIAGSIVNTSEKPYAATGSNGYAVRLIVDYLRHF